MKTINILVFSTRLIGEQRTIFQGIIRERLCPATIGKYFLSVNKDALDKMTPSISSDSRNFLEISNDIFDAAKRCSSDEYNYCNEARLMDLHDAINGEDLNNDWEQCKEMKKRLQDLLEDNPNSELQSALDKINLTGENQQEHFTLNHFEDEEILKKPAVNINLDKGKTLRDRITLYTLMDEDKNSDVRTIVYAVWPLGFSDKDEKDKDGNYTSKWVDCLTDAAINESELDSASAQIILLLHDHDLKSTQKTPFKTLYPFQEYKGLQRALAVFQHSNPSFREIIKPCDGGAKAVFEKAKKIVEDDVIFSHLKNLSDNMACYNSEKDNIKIENVLTELGKYNIIISEFLGGRVGTSKIGVARLLAANAEVNAKIKVLRTKEVGK